MKTVFSIRAMTELTRVKNESKQYQKQSQGSLRKMNGAYCEPGNLNHKLRPAVAQ
jgi:hypothetical protein